MDPYLLLDKDIRLKAICTNPNDKNCYGSQADDASAIKSLSAIESKDQQLKDTLSSHFVFTLRKSSEVFTTTLIKICILVRHSSLIFHTYFICTRKLYVRPNSKSCEDSFRKKIILITNRTIQSLSGKFV